MLAETLVTQRSPCYSAVSASSINPLPDCYNFRHFATPLPHSQDQYFTSLAGRTLYQAALLETNTSLLLRFTACIQGVSQCLMKLNNKQRQVVIFLLLLVKLLSHFPFVSFSFISICILSLLSFSILPLLAFLISTSLFILF